MQDFRLAFSYISNKPGLVLLQHSLTFLPFLYCLSLCYMQYRRYAGVICQAPYSFSNLRVLYTFAIDYLRTLRHLEILGYINRGAFYPKVVIES